MIENMTLVVGTSFRQDILGVVMGNMFNTQKFTGMIIAEPDNQYDPLAKKIMINAYHIGYIPRELTDTVSEGPCQIEIIYWLHKGVYIAKYIINE